MKIRKALMTTFEHYESCLQMMIHKAEENTKNKITSDVKHKHSPLFSVMYTPK